MMTIASRTWDINSFPESRMWVEKLYAYKSTHDNQSVSDGGYYIEICLKNEREIGEDAA
jgi:hypothetical protein